MLLSDDELEIIRMSSSACSLADHVAEGWVMLYIRLSDSDPVGVGYLYIYNIQYIRRPAGSLQQIIIFALYLQGEYTLHENKS